MEKSISEKEDQDYIGVKDLDNIDKNVVTPGTECGQEDEERSHKENSCHSNINTEFRKNMRTCGRQCWKVMGTRQMTVSNINNNFLKLGNIGEGMWLTTQYFISK
jgi:hypothetical protein